MSIQKPLTPAQEKRRKEREKQLQDKSRKRSIPAKLKTDHQKRAEAALRKLKLKTMKKATKGN